MRGPRLAWRIALLAPLALALSSCVSVVANAVIQPDGSVVVDLDYRVSRLVEAMGRVSGGSPGLPLPVDRAGLDRLASSIPGVSVRSYQERADESALFIKTSLSFTDPEALARFLQASGRTASAGVSGGRRTLSLRLAEGGGPLDPDLKRVVDALFKDYKIDLKLTFPTVPTVAGGGRADAATRTASYSSPLPELLSSTTPVVWIITW